SLPVAGDATLQEIVARQLEIMQAQIELLRGGSPSISLPSDTVRAANGGDAAHPAANGNGAHHPPATHPAAAAKTPDRIRAADVAAPAQAPASQGPHRPVSATIGLGGGYDERQARYFGEFVGRYTTRTRRSREYAARNRPVLADNRAALNFRMATK